MNAAIYYLSLPFIYAISILPFWWLYRLSDFLFVMLYHLFGYRREIVFENLKNSFPEKPEKELLEIQRKFYRYFCDLVMETLKSITISKSTLAKRVKFTGTEIFEEYYNQDQSVIIAMGHFGNWELGGARFAIEPFQQLFVIYHPLQNKYFDGLVYRMRTRLGNGLYSMKESLRGIIGDRKKVTAIAFIADQTPSPKGAHWMQFLNQDTPVFVGTGKIAKKMKYPVVYIGIHRLKRGQYEMRAEKLVTNPAEQEAIDIVEAFTKRLEHDIIKNPEIWLWTHRRWKHKRQINL
jgi:KDO2-lipid IV(A) lauroyltransferase